MSPTEFTHSPVIPIAAPFDLTDYPELAGISGISGTGLVTRIGVGSYTTRTLTGTTNQVNVADGNGVAGNPTISLPQDIHTGASPTFAGGTFTGDILVNGLTAGRGTASISTNTAFGVDALLSANASSFRNTAIGQNALRANTSGTQNTAVGRALEANTIGSNNTAIGRVALLSNVDGSGNIGIGNSALQSNVSGIDNIAIGYLAGQLTTGSNNIFIGRSAGLSMTTGSGNVIIGQTQTTGNIIDSNVMLFSTGGGIERFRVTSSGNLLLGTTTEAASSGLIQLATGTTAASGILAGTDTNLYRSAANQWTTDDSLLIAANTYIGATDAVVNRGGSGRIRISKDGTGATTNAGWEVGYLGTGSFSSIWSTLIGTPGLTNYAILATASSTQLNAAGASSGVLIFNIADTPQARLDDVSGFRIKSDKFVTWTSGVPSAVVDTTIGRNAAGDVAVGTGIAAAKAGALSLTLIKIETGTTASNGIVWGTDTNLYRSAANTLKTDDSLVVSGGLSASTLTTGSIPYIGAGGAIGDNNANLFWNNGGTALLIRSNSIGTNGALQVNGTVGVGSSGTNYIRPITNADVVSLILLATQVVVGNVNSDTYSYSGGGRLAVVTNADNHTLVDIGRGISTHARFKVVNTASGQAYTTFENSTTTAFRSFTVTGETIFGASSLATGEGRIHVAPHTTKAGGLYFGAANTNLYSSASGALKTDGVLTIAGTTDSSSSTTGALIVSGGVGIAKALYVANDLVVTPTASANRAVTITGSNGGNPTISVSAGSLAITPATVFASTITTIGGATFHTTSTALTNGAGAGAGTLTNAPAAGDPTKWIGINDNGTTRYIPTW